MVRTEIYANRSVEEDINEAIEKRFPGFMYSLFEGVQGRGKNGVRHGTAVWPELNILYVIYGNESEARLVGAAVAEVKKAFPKEGIKIFQYEVNAFSGKGADAIRSQT